MSACQHNIGSMAQRVMRDSRLHDLLEEEVEKLDSKGYDANEKPDLAGNDVEEKLNLKMSDGDEKLDLEGNDADEEPDLEGNNSGKEQKVGTFRYKTMW